MSTETAQTSKIVAKIGIYSIKKNTYSTKRYKNKFVFVLKGKTLIASTKMSRVVSFIMRKYNIKEITSNQFEKLQAAAEDLNQQLPALKVKESDNE